MQENVQVSNALGYGAPKLRNEVEQWSEAEGRNSKTSTTTQVLATAEGGSAQNFPLSVFRFPLKMLPVLAVRPVTPPLKASFRKKFIGKVIVVDFVREFFAPVEIGCGVRRLNVRPAPDHFVIGIVKRVDVHREA